MRTFKEFQNEFKGAHTCDKCEGKIICVTIDHCGNSRCAYCNQVVNYPRASKEELLQWFKESGDPMLNKLITELEK
jgi:late competence protein required for DNA uptake (superfamily II DNA/RNA helicase)